MPDVKIIKGGEKNGYNDTADYIYYRGDSGMEKIIYLCPFCDAETFIVDSRRSVKGTIRRRRECRKCGYRYSTYEVSSDQFKKLWRGKND